MVASSIEPSKKIHVPIPKSTNQSTHRSRRAPHRSQELGLRGRLTEFLTSGFWGPAGLITEAPVFSSKPKLPAFLGQFVYTAPLFNQGGAVGFKDLISILPFLYSAIDLTAEGAFEYYDAMSMAELLRRAGVTDAAYEYFLKPTLQVGLFAPPEELSAAVGIETLNL